MTDPTRSTHLVKITNPNNAANVIVVEVLDNVVFVGPNNEQFMYQLPAKGKGNKPYVLDLTGDTQTLIFGISGGDGTIGDPDHCSRVSHMEKLVSNTEPNQCIDVEVLDAMSFIGPNNAQWCITMSAKGVVEAITDNTNSNLKVPVQGSTTRAVHVAKITQLKPGGRWGSDNTDEPPISPEDEAKRFLLIKQVDKIAFKGPNNEQWLMIIPKAGANTKDTTEYTDDEPPENPDPNPYIRFPGNSQGPWLGADVPVAQGPFWWIKRAEPIPNPWYWWVPYQQPMAFQYVWDHWELSENHPYAWILNRNIPRVQIDPIGFASLEDAVDNGVGDIGGYFGGTIPSSLQTADYCLLPFTNPPNVAVPPPPSDPNPLFFSSMDNIWQLTGLPQPFEKDGFTPKYPKPQQAADAAHMFGDNWDAVAQGCNNLIKSWPAGPNPFDTDGPPPVWPWAIPWRNPFTGWGMSFDNGIPIGIGRAPALVMDPMTTWTLKVGQLDPDTWNTTVWPPIRW